MTNHFIRKPQQGGEWKSETGFRLWASVNKIDVIRGQPLICLTCGIINAEDCNGKCVGCGARNFIRADFQTGKRSVVFVDGDIHSKGKIEEKDIEIDKQLIMLGIIPARIKTEYIEKALAAVK